MRKTLTVMFVEDEPDMLGNDEHVETSIHFVGDESFVTMIFGGRDGSANVAIEIDELRQIFANIGRDA